MKRRHGCLTAWLVVMILANSASFLLYLLAQDMIREQLPQIPDWAFPVLIVGSLFNLICALALFRWKKWGFWGVCVSSIIVFVINLELGLGVAQSVFGLVGIALLYAVLHIGKEDQGWQQLE